MAALTLSLPITFARLQTNNSLLSAGLAPVRMHTSLACSLALLRNKHK
jgi:hypothetical protein